MQLVKYFTQLPEEQALGQDMLDLLTSFLKPLSHSVPFAAFLFTSLSGSPLHGSYNQGWIKTWCCYRSVKMLQCHIHYWPVPCHYKNQRTPLVLVLVSVLWISFKTGYHMSTDLRAVNYSIICPYA